MLGGGVNMLVIFVTADTFQFDRICLLFVALGDQDLTQLVLFGDAQFFFGCNSSAF